MIRWRTIKEEMHDPIYLRQPHAMRIDRLTAFALQPPKVGPLGKTIEEVWDWVATHIRFVPDKGSDDIRHPAVTMKERKGDCEDVSMLFLSQCFLLSEPAEIELVCQPDCDHVAVRAKGILWDLRKTKI